MFQQLEERSWVDFDFDSSAVNPILLVQPDNDGKLTESAEQDAEISINQSLRARADVMNHPGAQFNRILKTLLNILLSFAVLWDTL